METGVLLTTVVAAPRAAVLAIATHAHATPGNAGHSVQIGTLDPNTNGPQCS